MHIHNAIYNTIHKDGIFLSKASGIADFLLLYIKTPALLQVYENTYTITDPSVIIISGYSAYKYLSVTKPYCDDYIHFLPRDTDGFLKELHFPLNKPIKINNHHLIDPIIHAICREYYEATEYVLDIQYHQMMLLMARIGESWSAEHYQNSHVPYFENLMTIRKKVLADPTKNWKIKDLAKETTLSPAYFQVLYKKAFGTTCLSDTLTIKLQLRKNIFFQRTCLSLTSQLNWDIARYITSSGNSKKAPELPPVLSENQCGNFYLKYSTPLSKINWFWSPQIFNATPLPRRSECAIFPNTLPSGLVIPSIA